MNRKEIVSAAIRHRDTSRIPYHFDCTPPVRRMLREHFGTDDIDGAAGNYLVWLSPTKQWEDLGNCLKRDEFGVLWRVDGLNRGYVAEHPLKAPTLEGYRFPQLNGESRFAEFPHLCARYRDKFIVGIAGDLLERAGFLRGLDNILMDFHLNPRFVDELLDGLTEIILRNIEHIAQYDVDAVFISDDYGLQDRPMMSLDIWRRFIKPRLKRIFERIKHYGKVSVLHSCGDVSSFVADLIEIGLDVLHPIQPEAMDIFRLKREFGKHICFYGGISTQSTLRRATPDEVKREVRRVAGVMAEGGGYILAPSITLQHDIPLRNILAFIEAAQSL